jgi:hypothetical protein
LDYLDVLLEDRPVAYGFITDGFSIVFAKGAVESGTKRYWKRRFASICDESSMRSLITYFMASPLDFGRTPATIGNFLVGRRIGAGATSFVFAGQSADGNSKVALKLVAEGNLSHLDREEMIIREVRETIKHEQGLDSKEGSLFEDCLPSMTIVDYDVGHKTLRAGVVTPLGEASLSRGNRHLHQGGLGCILRALCASHHAGYVHRDMRPPNFLVLEHSRQVLLIDFGFAAAIGEMTTYAGASHFVPNEARGSRYKPWPMHDLAQLLQSLAYYADVLIDGIMAPPPENLDATRSLRMELPGNRKLAALGMLVAAAAEMPAAAPTLEPGKELESLLSSALKAVRDASLQPEPVDADQVDLGEERARALSDMVLVAVSSAQLAFDMSPLDMDGRAMIANIVNRPKRTLAGRWGWYKALLDVLGASKICAYDENLLPQGALDRLTLD